MIRVLIGVGLVGAAAYFGRRTSSGLSAPARTYVERALDDVGQFALTQFPREEIRAGEDPRHTDADYRMQCKELEPYLAAATQHVAKARAEDEAGTEATTVLVSQAWSAAAQPGRCTNLTMPDWLLQ